VFVKGIFETRITTFSFVRPRNDGLWVVGFSLTYRYARGVHSHLVELSVRSLLLATL
jgi:hypothetical protein